VRDQVEGEWLARVSRLLVGLAHSRRGYVLAEVFAAFGGQPLVAHSVVQKADAEGCSGRLEGDAACADEKMRGSELFGGVTRWGHGRCDCGAIPRFV